MGLLSAIEARAGVGLFTFAQVTSLVQKVAGLYCNIIIDLCYEEFSLIFNLQPTL